MSGRLIILPKKSYCPWNPANVERVLRDERLERERVEREEARQQEQESQQRLQTLKGDKKAAASTHQQHVNLFEAEEQAMLHQALTGDRSSSTDNNKGGTKAKRRGIMPVHLGDLALHGEPFYKRRAKSEVDSSNEERRKARLDPMRAFVIDSDASDVVPHSAPANASKEECTGQRRRRRKRAIERDDSEDGSHDDGSRRRRRRHYRKARTSSRRCHDHSAESEDSSSRRRRRERRRHRESKREAKLNRKLPIEDMRRRRQEREQLESKREAALIESHKPSRWFDQKRHYHDQYNPGLGRR